MSEDNHEPSTRNYLAVFLRPNGKMGCTRFYRNVSFEDALGLARADLQPEQPLPQRPGRPGMWSEAVSEWQQQCEEIHRYNENRRMELIELKASSLP